MFAHHIYRNCACKQQKHRLTIRLRKPEKLHQVACSSRSTPLLKRMGVMAQLNLGRAHQQAWGIWVMLPGNPKQKITTRMKNCMASSGPQKKNFPYCPPYSPPTPAAMHVMSNLAIFTKREKGQHCPSKEIATDWDCPVPENTWKALTNNGHGTPKTAHCQIIYGWIWRFLLAIGVFAFCQRNIVVTYLRTNIVLICIYNIYIYISYYHYMSMVCICSGTETDTLMQ